MPGFASLPPCELNPGLWLALEMEIPVFWLETTTLRFGHTNVDPLEMVSPAFAVLTRRNALDRIDVRRP